MQHIITIKNLIDNLNCSLKVLPVASSSAAITVHQLGTLLMIFAKICDDAFCLMLIIFFKYHMINTSLLWSYYRLTTYLVIEVECPSNGTYLKRSHSLKLFQEPSSPRHLSLAIWVLSWVAIAIDGLARAFKFPTSIQDTNLNSHGHKISK